MAMALNKTMTDNILKKLEKLNTDVKRISKKREFMYGCFVPNPKTTVMFVAEMPSSSKKWNSIWGPRVNFNVSPTDMKFMQALVKHGFGGSYITDLVKTSSKPRRPTEDEKKEWRPILKKEIQIIKPRLVVALKDTAFEALRDFDFPKGTLFYGEALYHPAAWIYKNHRSGYMRRIKRLAKYCQSL
ncbi:MAG: Uracil glycosylase superfamily [Candidatus Parcubacteria bacterium]|jgi:uracil-DNA glycosylase family 4